MKTYFLKKSDGAIEEIQEDVLPLLELNRQMRAMEAVQKAEKEKKILTVEEIGQIILEARNNIGTVFNSRENAEAPGNPEVSEEDQARQEKENAEIQNELLLMAQERIEARKIKIPVSKKI